MTVMAHYLAVLPEGIRATDLPEDWRRHVGAFQQRRFASWADAPVWMKRRPHKQLDWGTIAYELEEDDAALLCGGENVNLPELGSGERYVAIWVECW
jgi:hypothetical protein